MDHVIKIGGSLVEHIEKFKELIAKLEEYFQVKKFALITGGGELADVVRKYYQEYSLSETTAHWMAITTQNMLAKIVNALIKRKSVLINHLTQIDNLLSTQIPIIEPLNILKKNDDLPHSWDVTGDAIAIYVAKKINAKNVILLKDVDGLFSDYGNTDPVQLVKSVHIDELSKLEISPIDKHSLQLLKDSNINCWLVNGFEPSRILDILEGKDTICTKILS